MRARTRHPLVVDALLAAGSAGVAAFVLTELDSEVTEVGFASIVLVVVGSGALLVRRKWPLLVLLTVLAARLALVADTGSELALAPAAMVALYTVARTAARRSELLAAGGGAAVSATLVALLVAGDEPFLVELIGEVALMALPLAAGDAVRAREERVEARINAEAQDRVHQERLRIARDLHDIVAHGISTITVQAGVAAHLLDNDPGHAKNALEVINRTGRDTLDELRSMVGALRSDEEAPLAPLSSTPDDLSRVLDVASESGLSVDLHVDGAFPQSTSDACIVATHRILQEALRNVARHAGAVRVQVSLRHDQEAVHIEVCNGPGHAAADATASGVGIVGMKERAASVGGYVETERTADGGFRVEAALPHQGRRP